MVPSRFLAIFRPLWLRIDLNFLHTCRDRRSFNPLLKYSIRHDSITINAFLEIGIGIACNCFVACTDQIPSLTFYEYRGYVIGAWARSELTGGSTSIGAVYQRDMLGSMIQVQRIEDKLFESKEQAEQHGIELCKEWIDKHL